MAWELNEAIIYYRRQGAPADQTAVVNLLREIQTEHGSIPRDVLDIEGEEAPPATRVVGTYKASTSIEGGVSVSELELSVNAAEGAAFYTLSYGEDGIYTTEQHPTKDPFHYLTILIASLEDVTGTLYDRNGNELLTFRFDTQTQELITDNSET